MINRASRQRPSYVLDTGMVNIPPMSAGMFSKKGRRNRRLEAIAQALLVPKAVSDPSAFEYLYLQRLPITIQEHYRTSDRRQAQTPISMTISILRAHVRLLRPGPLACGLLEIARYFDAYAHTEL